MNIKFLNHLCNLSNIHKSLKAHAQFLLTTSVLTHHDSLIIIKKILNLILQLNERALNRHQKIIK